MCFENVIPGETEIEDNAFVDDLNFPNRLPVIESIWQTIPSTPAVYMCVPCPEEMALTPLPIIKMLFNDTNT